MSTQIDHRYTYYKCKKCRVDLFSSDQITSHKSAENDETCTQEIYIGNQSWFSEKTEEIKGRVINEKKTLDINCPKCDAKLGSFDWCGSICSCGAWITPAFHISSNKVDICKPINSQ